MIKIHFLCSISLCMQVPTRQMARDSLLPGKLLLQVNKKHSLYEKVGGI